MDIGAWLREVAQALADDADQNVGLGILPEHIVVDHLAARDVVVPDGTIVVTEQLGANQVLEIKVGQQSMMVSGVAPDLRADRNQSASFGLMTNHIHLFDAGERVRTILSAGEWSQFPQPKSENRCQPIIGAPPNE